MGVAEAQKFVHTLRSTFNALEVLIMFVWRVAIVNNELPFSFPWNLLLHIGGCSSTLWCMVLCSKRVMRDYLDGCAVRRSVPLESFEWTLYKSA